VRPAGSMMTISVKPARRSSNVRSIAASAVSPSKVIVFEEQVPQIVYVIALSRTASRHQANLACDEELSTDATVQWQIDLPVHGSATSALWTYCQNRCAGATDNHLCQYEWIAMSRR
jgi:hypothetical protein